MPIYEYHCQDCGAVSEVYAGIGDLNDPLSCKSCGSSYLIKLISSPVLTTISRPKGKTCCGKEERCEKPPCSSGETCRKGR